jgi:hypothetical protein
MTTLIQEKLSASGQWSGGSKKPLQVQRESRRDSAISELMFALLLGACCVWVLTLPVFPSQDGPMHKYYVSVVDNLLHHNERFAAYQIRHPLPPYVTHYAILLLLSRVCSYNTAEKVFVCLVLVCFAYSLRYSSRQIGPAGKWITLLCTPLLFAWPMMAGMFNFVLGISFALLATGLWQQIPKYGMRALIAFAAVLLVLSYTHPVPLLLLIVLCSLDLTLRYLLGVRSDGGPDFWWYEHRTQLAGFMFTLLAAAVPLMSVDRTQTRTTLSEFAVHGRLLGAHLLLYGISPYNSRSHSFWINAYRLCLYCIYAGCFWMGAQTAISMLRRKRFAFSMTCFAALLTLTLLVSFLPNSVNGSSHFADRLVFVLWPLAMLAAAAAPTPSPRMRFAIIVASIAFCASTLIAAQLYIRPLAHRVRTVELENLPRDTYGTILPGFQVGTYLRYHDQVAFDPFKWAPALAFPGRDDIVLNSPFISQTIAPLKPDPRGPLFNTEKDTPGSSNADLESVAGPSIPPWQEAQLMRNSSFVIYVATPGELTRGLTDRLSALDAAQFSCAVPRDWYVVCKSMRPGARKPDRER